MSIYRQDISRPTSKSELICWGCSMARQERSPGPRSPAECEAWDDDLRILGWIKRTFSSTVSIWFCSRECAYDSPNAVKCAAYWDKQKKPNTETEETRKISKFFERIRNFLGGGSY